nr:translational initiation factor 1 [Atalantia roxburghiana]UTS57504.1 translational initiation factor 1 [Atalantia roxburghiana]
MIQLEDIIIIYRLHKIHKKI